MNKTIFPLTSYYHDDDSKTIWDLEDIKPVFMF